MPLDTRQELEKLESERKTIISSLQKLESQIYDFEGSYLKETGAYGNAVKVRYLKAHLKTWPECIPNLIQKNQGWSARGFEKSEADIAANRKTEVKPETKDRIFSNSSISYSNFTKTE